MICDINSYIMHSIQCRLYSVYAVFRYCASYDVSPIIEGDMFIISEDMKKSQYICTYDRFI